jgi:hypothetical protein
MMDSWLCCHPSSLKHVLEAALVGETSSVMRGNKDGGPGILTEGFTIRLNDRVRPVAVTLAWCMMTWSMGRRY